MGVIPNKLGGINMKVKEHPIVDSLKELDIEAKIDPVSNQVFTVFHVNKKEFPLFFRELHDGKLLQILAIFPTNIISEKESDVSRLLHKINRQLDLPGLGMNEEIHTAFYRVVIDMVDKKSKKQALQVYLNTVKAICIMLSDAIEGLASGKLNYKQALQQFEKTVK